MREYVWNHYKTIKISTKYQFYHFFSIFRRASRAKFHVTIWRAEHTKSWLRACVCSCEVGAWFRWSSPPPPLGTDLHHWLKGVWCYLPLVNMCAWRCTCLFCVWCFCFCRAHGGGGRLRAHFGLCPSVRWLSCPSVLLTNLEKPCAKCFNFNKSWIED